VRDAKHDLENAADLLLQHGDAPLQCGVVVYQVRGRFTVRAAEATRFESLKSSSSPTLGFFAAFTVVSAVMDDIRPKAVKIGMINDAEIVKVIAESILKYHPEYVVFDPVMVSTSGCKLMEDEAIEAITTRLIPLASLITPNLSEAEILAGQKIRTVEDMKRQAKEMLKLGCKGVLIKGGHLDGGLMCDVLQTATEEAPHLFTAPKVDSRNTHGTGCTLSSAIATFLALGEPMSVAVKKAKQYVYKGIESGKDVCIGGGHGPLNHFHSPVAMHIFDKNE
jgi:hydroxymethylpyrimidine/phosphomethylpyrimidine kinase